MLAEAANATTNRPTILAALQQAAAATGADFHYLLGTAMRGEKVDERFVYSRKNAVRYGVDLNNLTR